MLKVCLTIDCENIISLKQNSPRWSYLDKVKGKINYLIRNFRYNRDGFNLIYEEIKKQRFPCSLMLVGSIYKPREKLPFIEWGYHTMNHRPLTLINDNEIQKEAKNIFNLESITTPLWMIEDINNPSRVFNILKKNGYKNVIYKGKDNREKCFHYLAIKKPEKKYGIKCLHLSNNFEGNSSKEHINKIKREIINNSDKNAVYVLSTHDFTHKNLRNLREIIYFLRNLEKSKKIKLVNMKNA